MIHYPNYHSLQVEQTWQFRLARIKKLLANDQVKINNFLIGLAFQTNQFIFFNSYLKVITEKL